MSLEKSCEDIEILLLANQADLSGISCKNYVEDDDANKDRIIVKAEPRQPALVGSNGVTVHQWMIPVGVTIKLTTKTDTQMDTIVAAVTAANNTTAAPAGAITAAQAAFSGGPRIENLEGERESEEHARLFTLRFAFYVFRKMVVDE